ncbi:gamma-glutamyltransferase [bacterium]|nr:gamma-glutamyltransferase [bacterium]
MLVCGPVTPTREACMQRTEHSTGRRNDRFTTFIPIFLTFLLLVALTAVSFAKAPDPAWGRNGMVSSAHPLATQAGVEVLRDGGNAVDAALAVAYMLNVVEGYSAGIGGGEFWVVRWAKTGEIVCVDGREEAPAAAHRDMYVDSTGNVIEGLSTTGILAGGVPGSVAAREYALDRWGSLSRKRLMRPAIETAEEGFMVNPYQAAYYAYLADKIGQFETSRAVMFKNDTTTWETGDYLVQKDLAETFKRIARDGAEEFYHGQTAREIVRYMEEQGGLITAEDLANYEIKLREPIYGTYRDGYEIYSMPPPSSGGTHVVQILNILEGWDLAQFGRYSSRYYHHLGQAMMAAFADRAEYLGDPEYVEVPREGLVSKSYAEELRMQIPALWSREVPGPGDPWAHQDIPENVPGEGHTTHLSVIDKWGNMVALTATINTGFGAGVILGGTGIWLNNEMDDFSAAPGKPNYFGLIGKEANAIAPDKRPLSSMSPTLVMKDGEPFMAVGASGGPKIITATLQTMVNVIDFGADIQEAISDPRVHHQWRPMALFVDPDISPDCMVELHSMGHRVAPRWVSSGVQGVMIDHETGMMYGGADPRSGGSALGLP